MLPISVGNLYLPNQNNNVLSEVSNLKAQILSLNIQLAQVKIDLLDRENRLVNCNLSNDKARLELEFRKELKCEATDKFNWALLKCEKVTDVKKDNSF
jgi:hypothetical protein